MEQRTGWEEKVPRKPMVKRSISTEGVAGTSGFEVVFVGASPGSPFPSTGRLSAVRVWWK